MNRTKIEWTDYTWNPVTGCLHNCPYCYGRKIANRFKKLFPMGYLPTFYSNRLEEPYNSVPKNFRSRNPHLPKGSAMIFTVSMGDLFGIWVPREWIYPILKVVKDNPQHVFQFLTKYPIRYSYSKFEFPRNAWIGATLDGVKLSNLREVRSWLLKAKKPSVRFLSFEPLLKQPSILGPDDFEGIDWIIIGAQTNPYKPPKPEWVEHIVKSAKKLEIPVFLKDNLRWPEKIQEFPEAR